MGSLTETQFRLPAHATNNSVFDLSFFRGTVEARFVYVFILGILFSGTKDLLRSQIITADAKLKSRGLWEIYSGLVLLVSLLFRAHNLPVLCCCLLIQTLMAQFIWKKLHYDAAQTTIMHYWFGQAFFYFQVSWLKLILFKSNYTAQV